MKRWEVRGSFVKPQNGCSETNIVRRMIELPRKLMTLLTVTISRSRMMVFGPLMGRARTKVALILLVCCGEEKKGKNVFIFFFLFIPSLSLFLFRNTACPHGQIIWKQTLSTISTGIWLAKGLIGPIKILWFGSRVILRESLTEILQLPLVVTFIYKLTLKSMN